MIISASYKTDIPTFYGEWFMRRLAAGYCKTLNPYNNTISTVSLRREDVDGFVFWTKNAGPFLRHLPTIRERGFPFVVQHTINGYPRSLESSVTDARRSVEYVRRIADEFGPDVVVWRYDTIILTSITDWAFHRRNFEDLCRGLEGAVNEVVISFAHLYQKTVRNTALAAEEHGFRLLDPSDDEKRELASDLVSIAGTRKIRLSVCAQPAYLVDGATEARCVDADRVQRIAGLRFQARVRGNRKECGCFESRDIGEYDTCPHGCVYCYAVRDVATAKRRFAEHDPDGELLFRPPASARDVGVPRHAQLPLFSGS